ncbi:hypothetical protein ACHWQZ_G003266 [Mnemiopsis leidyi]
MQKIWEQLNKDFKSSRTDESSRFLGELPFEIDSFIPGYASSSDVDTSNRLSCRIAGVKHKPVVSPGVHSSHRLKKIRPNVEPAVNFAFDSRKSTKNYKFVHRSTVVRQAARIKDLRAKNSDSKREMAEKNLTILGLSCELKRTHTEHRALTLKLKEMSSMHEKICQASNVYRKKWEDAKSDIRFLSNKLLELEELQMNADHVESKLDDPDFEIDSAIEKANDDFAAGNFPKMKVRNSIKEINPKIYLGIILIRNIGRVSLENTMPLLAALANSIFGQSWELGNFTPKTRQRHALPPCQNKEDRPTKKKILENTLPAKSFTRSLEKNILEPASLRSSALALKESDVGSLIFDHLSIKRGKAITVGVTTGNIDSKANEKKTKHMTLAVKQVVDTTAKGTFRSVVEILRLAAAAAADSASAEDVQKSFKEILAKLKFQVTDDASQMRSVCDKFTELRNLLDSYTDMANDNPGKRKRRRLSKKKEENSRPVPLLAPPCPPCPPCPPALIPRSLSNAVCNRKKKEENSRPVHLLAPPCPPCPPCPPALIPRSLGKAVCNGKCLYSDNMLPKSYVKFLRSVVDCTDGWILIDALGKEFEKPNKEILTWAHHEQDNAGIGPHKGRVQTDVSCKWIRATQGHYRPENGGAGVEPMGTPVNKGIGVHVTQKRFFAGIRSQGLKPCGRMGVHFAEGHPADKRQSGVRRMNKKFNVCVRIDIEPFTRRCTSSGKQSSPRPASLEDIKTAGSVQSYEFKFSSQ